ncbi:ribonuclease H protein [Trifolium medium]|uniref:Ribonuclease H protein n=1 Tax=Trifolium medium TaxID=97028 RepID=A0A392QLV7_9FABA|nr:ribonuclease H protein [Trifolium medium]
MTSSREGTVWRWEWRDALTQVEEYDLIKLKELLLDVNLNPNSADRWRWILGSAGLFSVKSCYNFLIQNDSAEALHPTMLEAIKKLWKNDVPSKVSVFGWRLLLEKLPTRAALASKGIITNPYEISCARVLL